MNLVIYTLYNSETGEGNDPQDPILLASIFDPPHLPVGFDRYAKVGEIVSSAPK